MANGSDRVIRLLDRWRERGEVWAELPAVLVEVYGGDAQKIETSLRVAMRLPSGFCRDPQRAERFAAAHQAALELVRGTEERWLAFRRDHDAELQALPLNRAHGRLGELRAEFLAAERVRARLLQSETITLPNGKVLVPAERTDTVSISNLYRTTDGRLWRVR